MFQFLGNCKFCLSRILPYFPLRGVIHVCSQRRHISLFYQPTNHPPLVAQVGLMALVALKTPVALMAPMAPMNLVALVALLALMALVALVALVALGGPCGPGRFIGPGCPVGGQNVLLESPFLFTRLSLQLPLAE